MCHLLSFSGTKESGNLGGFVAREDMMPSRVGKPPLLRVDKMSWFTVRVVSSSVTLAGGSSERASRTAWKGKDLYYYDIFGVIQLVNGRIPNQRVVINGLDLPQKRGLR